MKRELIFKVIKVCAKFNSAHSEVFPGYIISSTELMRRISNAERKFATDEANFDLQIEKNYLNMNIIAITYMRIMSYLLNIY